MLLRRCCVLRIKTELRFICIFILLLLSGQSVYYFSKAKFENIIENVLIGKLNVGAVVKILNMINSNDPVVQMGKNICSNGIKMTVATGCDGIDGLLIIVSAMIAFPMILSRKITGIVLGVALVYLVNLMRIIMLYYILKYIPDWFEFTHTFIGQFMVIFAGCMFFLLWVNSFEKKNIFPNTK